MQSTTSSTIAEPAPGTDLEELARILAGELGAARACAYAFQFSLNFQF